MRCLTCTAFLSTYAFSLHDALPISSVAGGTVFLCCGGRSLFEQLARESAASPVRARRTLAWHPYLWSSWKDRKSTRLNSSHLVISYAVFCLKNKSNGNNL